MPRRRPRRPGAACRRSTATRFPAAAIGLDDGVDRSGRRACPAAPAAARRRARRGRQAAGLDRRARRRRAPTQGGVAPFSSRGLAFDGLVKPDLVAPGVGLADGRPGEDGGRLGPLLEHQRHERRGRRRRGRGGAARRRRGPTSTRPRSRACSPASARPLPRESVAAQGTGLARHRARPRRARSPALPTTLELRPGDRRRLACDAQARRAQPLVTAGCTRRVRRRRRDAAARRSRSCSRSRLAGAVRPTDRRRLRRVPALGADRAARSRACSRSSRGSTPIRVPWSSRSRPRRRPAALRRPALHSEFRPSDTAPAVLSFQAGRIAARRARSSRWRGSTLDSARRDGARLGVLAQLRDLLPGRYAFGLTGRDANGDTLEPGSYRLLLPRTRPARGRRPRRRAVHDSVIARTGLYSPPEDPVICSDSRSDS